MASAISKMALQTFIKRAPASDHSHFNILNRTWSRGHMGLIAISPADVAGFVLKCKYPADSYENTMGFK